MPVQWVEDVFQEFLAWTAKRTSADTVARNMRSIMSKDARKSREEACAKYLLIKLLSLGSKAYERDVKDRARRASLVDHAKAHLSGLRGARYD